MSDSLHKILFCCQCTLHKSRHFSPQISDSFQKINLNIGNTCGTAFFVITQDSDNRQLLYFQIPTHSWTSGDSE
ncbi:N-acetylmuramoyl-L-alanine amidase CwlA [Dirofilaria immitis]